MDVWIAESGNCVLENLLGSGCTGRSIVIGFDNGMVVATGRFGLEDH